MPYAIENDTPHHCLFEIDIPRECMGRQATIFHHIMVVDPTLVRK